MINKKLIFRIFSTLLVISFLMIKVFPVFAESFANTQQINSKLAWLKGAGGFDYDQGWGIEVDSNGNTYTTGRFWGTADFDPGTDTYNLTSAGWFDIFVCKLDKDGNFVWAKSIGGTNNDESYDIALDSNDNAYITGGYTGTADFDPNSGIYNLVSSGNRSIFISKLDSNGNLIWAKSMHGSDSGGNAYGIAVDSIGNIYSTGNFQGSLDFDPSINEFILTKNVDIWDSNSNPDIFVMKLDNDGNFVWAKSMGGANGGGVGSDIAFDTTNKVYVTGHFFGTTDFDSGIGTNNLISAGGSDIFISKLDSNGNLVWAKRIGGTDTISSDVGRGIAVDPNGYVYSTGSFSQTVDFDPSENIFNLTTVGDKDIFISKLDINGNFIWAKSMGGATTPDSGWGITLDSDGNVFTIGDVFGYVDVDPDTDIFYIDGIFISKLDNNGNFVWAKGIGDNQGGGGGTSIIVDSMGNVYSTGYFRSTTFFQPHSDLNTDINNLTSVGLDDFFILKLQNDPDAPSILNIICANVNPSNTTNINFTVTFSEDVTGVDADGSDFSLVTSGLTGTSITGVTPVSASVYTVSVNTGAGDGTIRLDVLNDGTIKDAALNPLASTFTNGQVYDIDKVAPSVVSSIRINPNPTNLSSVDFTITFSESVTNVGIADFLLTTSGVSEATVSGVSGSGTTYTVTVNTGSSSGAIRLDVLNDGTIQDTALNSLSSAFTSGESYTVIKPITLPLKSLAANDGWILESKETSGKGGTMNSIATTFNLGDDLADRQYRAILHFNTSSLPDTAVITLATLKIRKQGQSGSNPFTILGNLRVDMRKPAFGSAALALTDFKSAAGQNNVSTFGVTPAANWYSAILNSTGNSYINRTGTTQFRLYFTTDDNNDNGNDLMKFFSGNAGAASHPQLIIEYYVP